MSCRGLEAGSILDDDQNVSDYGSTEHDCGVCGDFGGPWPGPCGACGMPWQGDQGTTCGDIHVWPDGSFTAKPMEVQRREAEEEEEAWALSQLDLATWRGSEYEERDVVTGELLHPLDE
jgi:hypothetical protein